METKKEIKQEHSVILRPDVPTIFSEQLRVAHRKDGMFLLSWLQSVPETFIEQARILVTKEHIKLIINSLCETANYYPEKPDSIDKKQSPSS